MMKAWQEMNGESISAVWDRFEEEFLFRPSVHQADWPGIHEPSPSETYSISEVYNGDGDHYSKLNRELQDWGLSAFQALLTTDTEHINVLDWQHPCYRFRPLIPFDLDKFGEWPIPILPNGDYYIFLDPDFAWGIFGHPWEQTMCLFGAPLLACLETGRPTLLTELVRRNGKAA